MNPFLPTTSNCIVSAFGLGLSVGTSEERAPSPVRDVNSFSTGKVSLPYAVEGNERNLSAMYSRIIVWDVGHGSSVSIVAPNGRITMIDLGANVDTGFSPIKFTKTIWSPKSLDYLILSHPHVDHIRDIVNLKLEEFLPVVLLGRVVPREKLIGEGINENDRETLETYLELKSRYSDSVDASHDSRDPALVLPAHTSRTTQ